MPTGVIALSLANTPGLVSLARTLFREYSRSLGIDLEYQGFEAELASLPEPYAPPGGALLIAHVNHEPAGCVGLRPLDSGIGEMKRLYVRPAYRHMGLGYYMVKAVIEAARQAGHRVLCLDTLASMTSAQALYRRLGFAEIPPYSDKYLPGTRFFALGLNREDGSTSDEMDPPPR